MLLTDKHKPAFAHLAVLSFTMRTQPDFPLILRNSKPPLIAIVLFAISHFGGVRSDAQVDPLEKRFEIGGQVSVLSISDPHAFDLADPTQPLYCARFGTRPRNAERPGLQRRSRLGFLPSADLFEVVDPH